MCFNIMTLYDLKFKVQNSTSSFARCLFAGHSSAALWRVGGVSHLCCPDITAKDGPPRRGGGYSKRYEELNAYISADAL